MRGMNGKIGERNTMEAINIYVQFILQSLTYDENDLTRHMIKHF